MSPARPLLRALPAAVASPLARHRAFLGLRAAGGREDLRLSPLERVLRRAPRPVVQHTSLLLQAFHLRQSLRQLHVRNVWARQEAPVRQQLLVRMRDARAGAIAPQARQQAVPRMATVPRQPVAAQGMRDRQAPAFAQRAEPALSAVLRRAEVRAAYPRVGATLARPPAARAAEAQARQHADFPVPSAGHDALRPPRGTPAAAQDWTVPPRELARITASVSHQVIGQLERRALSLRERSGRV